MRTTSIETITKMMESLPEATQNIVVEQVKNYITELEDENRWDSLFIRTQDNLIKAAQQAKRKIALGKNKPMDYNRL